MDYGRLVSESWRITWNNKFLWVLGFLAALTSVSSSGNSGRTISQRLESGDVSPEMITAVSGAILLLVCIGFVLGIVLMLVSLAAQGSLISAVARLDDGEKVTLGEAFGAGTQAIIRLFGVSFLLWLPVILVVVLVAIIGIASAGGFAAAASIADNPERLFAGLGFLAICLVGLCCALIPLAIVISVVYEFALRGTMLENLGVTDSIRWGWRVVRNNIADIIVLLVLFWGIGILYAILVGLIMIPLALVVFVPTILMFNSGSTPNVATMGLLIGGGICLGVLGAVLNSVIVTWRSAAFTLAYRQLTAKGKV